MGECARYGYQKSQSACEDGYVRLVKPAHIIHKIL